MKKLLLCTLGFCLLMGCSQKQEFKNPNIAFIFGHSSTGNTEPLLVLRGTSGPIYSSLSSIGRVYFDYNSSQLTEQAMAQLMDMSDLLKKNDDEIFLEGHGCGCGSNKFNFDLASERVQRVKTFLVGNRLGISPERIVTLSYGEERPIKKDVGPPDSPDCALNRRVEIKIRSN